MSPPTQWAILCIELAIIFAFAWIAWRAMKRGREDNERADALADERNWYVIEIQRRDNDVERLASERNEAMKAAARWQQQAGENADDATKWRLHRAARIRRDANRAIPQATLKAQTTAALREGG